MRDLVREEAASEKLQRLLRDFASRRRPVRVVRKSDYPLQRLADLGLRIVTLNGQSRYLTHYVTTLGHTIYVPDDFDEWPAAHRYEILRHELVHVLQFERYGWIGMILIYGILPLPLGLSYGRARLEWEAYAETLRAVAECEGFEAACDPALRDMIVRRFTGPDYGWMWPFAGVVRRWIREELDRIQARMNERPGRVTVPFTASPDGEVARKEYELSTDRPEAPRSGDRLPRPRRAQPADAGEHDAGEGRTRGRAAGGGHQGE